MKKLSGIFRNCVVVSLIMITILLTNSTLINSKDITSNGYIIDMNKWLYYTSENSNAKEINLPWSPKYDSKDLKVYMKSTIPSITCNQTLLIKTYMKEAKVYIKGEKIYDSNLYGDKTFIRTGGRGLYFVDISSRYSEEDIVIEICSSFPQSDGEIVEVSLGNKASHIMNIIKENSLDNMIAIALIFTGIMAIIIFLTTFIVSTNHRNLLCIGIFTILCGLWIIAQSNLYQIIYNNPNIGYLVEFISYYIMPIPLFIYIITTYNIKHKNIVKVLIGIFTAHLILILILQMLKILALHELLLIYNITLILSFTILLFILIGELKRKDKDFILFFTGFCIMNAGIYLDMLLFYVSDRKEINGFFKIGLVIFIITISLTIGKYIIRLHNKKIRDQALMDLAYRDISTGLYNRRAFEDYIASLTKSLNENSNIVMLVIDLDNLKTVNDNLGHIEGDKMILVASSIIKYAYREIGNIYRIGGDEFVVIAKGFSLEEIEKCNEKRDKLIKEEKSKISMSCGQAVYNSEIDKDLYSLFSRADEDMYIKKREKKEIRKG